MPKIPVYEQKVEMAAGSLGPRANSGAFETPGRSLASLGQQVTDTAYQFGMMERNREDKRIQRESYNTAFEAIGTATLQDKSTDIKSAENNFNSVRDKILSDIDAQDYGKRRTELIKSDLQKLFLQKGLEAKQNAYNRGNAVAGSASDKLFSTSLEELKKHDPKSAQFQFQADLLRASVEDDNRNGIPTKFNPINLESQISAISKDNTRDILQQTIRGATAEDLNKIEQQINASDILESSDKSVLYGNIDKRKTELESNALAPFSNYINVDNIGENDFATVEAEAEKLEKARVGDFGTDKAMQTLWDNLPDEAARKKAIAAMEGSLSQARRNLTYKQGQADRQQKDANDTLFADNMPQVRDGTLSLERINELEFQGTEGERLREQMVTAAINTIEGAPLTTDNFRKDSTIDSMVMNKRIMSITQKFKLPGESEDLSILERENLHLTSKRVQEYFDFFRAEDRLGATEERRLIAEFLKLKELRVRGSSLLVNKPTPASDARMEIFTASVNQFIREGKEKGFSVQDMLNPNNQSTYIMPDAKLNSFRPSKQTLQNEAKEMFGITDSISGYTREDVKPPTKADMGLPANATISQIEGHPVYKAWENSFSGFVYKELMSQ